MSNFNHNLYNRDLLDEKVKQVFKIILIVKA
jgi:hypothetical protein